jgi:hypothetical protein
MPLAKVNTRNGNVFLEKGYETTRRASAQRVARNRWKADKNAVISRYALGLASQSWMDRDRRLEAANLKAARYQLAPQVPDLYAKNLPGTIMTYGEGWYGENGMGWIDAVANLASSAVNVYTTREAGKVAEEGAKTALEQARLELEAAKVRQATAAITSAAQVEVAKTQKPGMFGGNMAPLLAIGGIGIALMMMKNKKR